MSDQDAEEAMRQHGQPLDHGQQDRHVGKLIQTKNENDEYAARDTRIQLTRRLVFHVSGWFGNVGR